MNELRLSLSSLSQCQDTDACQKLQFHLILTPSPAGPRSTTLQWVPGLTETTAKLSAWDKEPSGSLRCLLVCFLWLGGSLVPKPTCLAGPSFIGIQAPPVFLVSDPCKCSDRYYLPGIASSPLWSVYQTWTSSTLDPLLQFFPEHRILSFSEK